MRIGLSYWSKDGKAEFAAHEFDGGQITGLGQFTRDDSKHTFSGEAKYVREGLKQLIDDANRALEALEHPTDQPTGKPDRARPTAP